MKPKTDTSAIPQPQEQKLEPCHHMEGYVSALSDGSLSGPARWYTRFHLLTCPKCTAALRGLQALESRLASLAEPAAIDPALTLTSDRRAEMEQKLNEIDQR